MNDTQMLNILVASLPSMITVLIGILINNSRLSDVNARIADLRAHLDVRLDEQREVSRAELRRVEEVLDARLKHMEERFDR